MLFGVSSVLKGLTAISDSFAKPVSGITAPMAPGAISDPPAMAPARMKSRRLM